MSNESEVLAADGAWGRPDHVGEWLRSSGLDVALPVTIQRVGIGQSNITSIVTDSNGFSCVLREPPLGASGASHDMTREMRTLDALAGSGIAVPTVLARGTFADGRAYYAMNRLPGTVLESEDDAEKLDPSERAGIARDAAETLGRLHAIDPESVGLGHLISSTPYVERQVSSMERAWLRLGSSARHDAAWERLTEALKRWLPAGETRSSVVHGDYRVSNLLVDQGGVSGVLDWELSTVGDPLVDLAWLLDDWTSPEDPASAMPSPTRAGGFGTRQDFVERYAQVIGDDPDRGGRLAYYRALTSWRAATLIRGVAERRRSGVMGEVSGPSVDSLEETIAWKLQCGLELIEDVRG